MSAVIHHGDVRDVLARLEPESVQCVVTSPPYFGLRDYGTAQWDGGDAECDHKHGGQVPQTKHRAASASFATGLRPGTDNSVCGKCGARRIDQQIGLEATPAAFVAALVDVFREVRRVLRPDGTCWLNLGDSYAGAGYSNHHNMKSHGSVGRVESGMGSRGYRIGGAQREDGGKQHHTTGTGVKAKDLLGIPWRVAFALQEDGWYLRSAITWCKTAPMPESVTDRPTSATEMIFLLTRSPRYYYDAEAVKVPSVTVGDTRHLRTDNTQMFGRNGDDSRQRTGLPQAATRNLWNYWLVGPEPYAESHFAVFPTKLIEPCILAGTSERGQCPACGAPWRRVVEREREYDHVTTQNGKSKIGPYANQTGNGAGTHDIRHGVYSRSTTTGWQPSCTCDAGDPVPQTVLDPFCGSGTTGVVALRHGRSFVGIELNAEYVQLARNRITQDAPLFNKVTVTT